jgi:hypothetical protein
MSEALKIVGVDCRVLVSSEDEHGTCIEFEV